MNYSDFRIFDLVQTPWAAIVVILTYVSLQAWVLFRWHKVWQFLGLIPLLLVVSSTWLILQVYSVMTENISRLVGIGQSCLLGLLMILAFMIIWSVAPRLAGSSRWAYAGAVFAMGAILTVPVDYLNTHGVSVRHVDFPAPVIRTSDKGVLNISPEMWEVDWPPPEKTKFFLSISHYPIRLAHGGGCVRYGPEANQQFILPPGLHVMRKGSNLVVEGQKLAPGQSFERRYASGTLSLWFTSFDNISLFHGGVLNAVKSYRYDLISQMNRVERTEPISAIFLSGCYVEERWRLSWWGPVIVVGGIIMLITGRWMSRRPPTIGIAKS